MQPIPGPKPADDPHDIIVVPPSLVQVAPADDETADELSSLLKAAARHNASAQPQASATPPAAAAPRIDATFRPGVVGAVRATHDQRSIGRTALRAGLGLVLTAGIGAAALGWQSSGDVAKQMIATWAPESVLSALRPLRTMGLPAQSDAAPVQSAEVPATAEAPTPQPLVQSQEAAPAAAPSSADAEQLQALQRDLAAARQDIDQLKANIEQLKSSQELISRDVAKLSAPAARPKPPAPRAAAVPLRRPVASYAPPPPSSRLPPPPMPSQAAAPAYPPPAPPPQGGMQPDGEPVVRPPLPMRWSE